MPEVSGLWVKYHFKTDQGNEFLTNDEAAAIAAADPDAHIRDLYDDHRTR